MKSLMKKIFSYLKRYWKIVVLVLVLVVGMFLFTCEDKRTNKLIGHHKDRIIEDGKENEINKEELSKELIAIDKELKRLDANEKTSSSKDYMYIERVLDKYGYLRAGGAAGAGAGAERGVR